VVTLPVAVGMVWRFILNGDFGLLNYVLSLFGIPGQYWVADDRFAVYAFAVVGIWMGLGVNLIILGAGLQNIPADLYEASALDGANRVRQFFSITLPLLSPSVFFVTILTTISALQMFDLVFIMLGSINNTALSGSKTIVYLFYEAAFVQFKQGYAAAIAIVLLVIIMIVTAIQFSLQKKWVVYD
jgi:multiple sugar transport system permease protein